MVLEKYPDHLVGSICRDPVISCPPKQFRHLFVLKGILKKKLFMNIWVFC